MSKGDGSVQKIHSLIMRTCNKLNKRRMFAKYKKKKEQEFFKIKTATLEKLNQAP